MIVRRTYATWYIEWTRTDPTSGQHYAATWTGYSSAAEAQATINRAHDAGAGVVVEKRFTVDLDLAAPSAVLYRPSNIGVADVELSTGIPEVV